MVSTVGLAVGPALLAAAQAVATTTAEYPTIPVWDLLWKVPVGVYVGISAFAAAEEIDETSLLSGLNSLSEDFDMFFI